MYFKNHLSNISAKPSFSINVIISQIQENGKVSQVIMNALRNFRPSLGRPSIVPSGNDEEEAGVLPGSLDRDDKWSYHWSSY